MVRQWTKFNGKYSYSFQSSNIDMPILKFNPSYHILYLSQVFYYSLPT